MVSERGASMPHARLRVLARYPEHEISVNQNMIVYGNVRIAQYFCK